MYLILLGPPGSGKGTHAKRLCKELNLPHVASGDLFRDHLKRESELGKLAQSYMDIGQLVPDDVTIAMVKERLSSSDCREGTILDGFPRTLAQAEALDSILQELGQQLTGVVAYRSSRRCPYRTFIGQAHMSKLPNTVPHPFQSSTRSANVRPV